MELTYFAILRDKSGAFLKFNDFQAPPILKDEEWGDYVKLISKRNDCTLGLLGMGSKTNNIRCLVQGYVWGVFGIQCGVKEYNKTVFDVLNEKTLRINQTENKSIVDHTILEKRLKSNYVVELIHE